MNNDYFAKNDGIKPIIFTKIVVILKKRRLLIMFGIDVQMLVTLWRLGTLPNADDHDLWTSIIMPYLGQ